MDWSSCKLQYPEEPIKYGEYYVWNDAHNNTKHYFKQCSEGYADYYYYNASDDTILYFKDTI